MSLRKEVADLKERVEKLQRELYERSGKFHVLTHIEYPRMINSVHVGEDDYPIVKAVQLILDHLDLKLEKTPEKIKLVQKEN